MVISNIVIFYAETRQMSLIIQKMFQAIRLKCHFGILIQNLKISSKALMEDLEHNPDYATYKRSLGFQLHNSC